MIAKYPALFKNKEKILSMGLTLSPDGTYKAIEDVKPDIVINCIGIIKQLKEIHDPIPSISINSLFPHAVAKKCNGVWSGVCDQRFTISKGVY